MVPRTKLRQHNTKEVDMSQNYGLSRHTEPELDGSEHQRLAANPS